MGCIPKCFDESIDRDVARDALRDSERSKRLLISRITGFEMSSSSALLGVGSTVGSVCGLHSEVF